MDEGRGRQRAYADLLSGLIDLGPSAATDRFDALLEQARSSGLIDPETARVLRWWQRESLRAQADHILSTAPAMLTALDSAHAQALESAALAESAWDQARASLGNPVAQGPSGPPAQHDPGVGEGAVADAAMKAGPPDGSVPAGRHRAGPTDDGAEDTPLFDEVLATNDVEAPAAVEPPVDRIRPVDPVEPIERVGPIEAVEPIDTVGAADVVDLDAPGRRRRLLVAGLTVLDADRGQLPLADPP